MTTADHYPGCHPECAPQREDTMTPADKLAKAAAAYRNAQDDLAAARDNLAAAVRDAVAEGMSQSEAARIVGVDRLTIRKWIAS